MSIAPTIENAVIIMSVSILAVGAVIAWCGGTTFLEMLGIDKDRPAGGLPRPRQGDGAGDGKLPSPRRGPGGLESAAQPPVQHEGETR